MTDLGLTEHQRVVAARVLDEEGARRRHLVVSLSGAHAYGFPSPDSDLDLKAVHVAPTRSLLGMEAPTGAAERLEVVDGVEIDYTSNELQAVLRGVLAGNGNFIERILGASQLEAAPALAGLKGVVAAALSRRVHRHYRGFARSQRDELDAAPLPTNKRILYVLRTALTGVHLLKTKEVVTDLSVLCRPYGFPEAEALIAAKRAGEQSPLAPEVREAWRPRLDQALLALDQALDTSPLPESPDSRPLEAWLVEHRLLNLAGG